MRMICYGVCTPGCYAWKDGKCQFDDIEKIEDIEQYEETDDIEGNNGEYSF